MPAFIPLKRKADFQDIPNKRPYTNPADELYWMVQWRNPQQKKHKTWEGDGVLVVKGLTASLYDLEQRPIGSGRAVLPLEEGKQFSVGGKEIELDREISRQEYLAGTCFGSGASTAALPNPISSRPAAKAFIPPKAGRSAPKQHASPLSTTNSAPPVPKHDENEARSASCWTANWRKHQAKKHKTWEGDAYISLVGDKLTMLSEDGKIMGTATHKGGALYEGAQLTINGKYVELDCPVSASQLPIPNGAEEEVEELPSPVLMPISTTKPVAPSPISVTPKSFYAPVAKKPIKKTGPLHDPDAEGAIVMKPPTKEQIAKHNKNNAQIIPVVLDPTIAVRLRPHQIEGVRFMYECVMGLRKHEGEGCILADEMGLGKTLQTVALIWTLLKQNPYGGHTPFIQKVLIVCPVSLVNNWKNEFKKWLGSDRLGVIAWGEKNVIHNYVHNARSQVLILGYERLKTVVNQLTSVPIGLIVCDEGHRLKSANNKTTAAFKAFKTRRRIILSGTPIQNDLSEFHAMADFCNPGLLDDYNTFRRVYETPILKSRSPDSTEKELEIGEARSAQLLSISKSFVLRRDASLLKGYLPPKTECIVFVTPTPLQLTIFRKILNPEKLDDLTHGTTAESLALINMLTKISNSPILLKATADKAKISGTGDNFNSHSVMDAVRLLPQNAQVDDVTLSGKLTAIASLLASIQQNTEEKVVLVSHYTSTLSILEAFCKRKHYSYFRLDGQTPAAKRQEYVNQFNKSTQRGGFIFLLSSKAGGVGINLIGASRLCLIDSDWNPSHDLQSMARIHRDGQKRPVFIYRFITAGTIDEKIYQRQVTKLGLSDAFMDSGKSSSKIDSFSRKDLRNIFSIHPDTACQTHDLLECPCLTRSLEMEEDDSNLDGDSDGEETKKRGFISASQVDPEKMDKAYMKKKREGLAALGEWKHILCLHPSAHDEIHDVLLRQLVFPHDVRPVLVKQPGESRVESLLNSVDISNMPAGPVSSVSDLPGGSVTFVFEKITSHLNGESSGDGDSDQQSS